MREKAVALLCGVVFGLGLLISHMADPGKVLNFLDVFGTWDPSLALVMGTAVPVSAAGYAIAKRMSRPVVAAEFRLPANAKIDRGLMIGAAVFGVGWGLGGYCPGPAITALGLGRFDAFVFAAAMLAGMALYELMQERTLRPSTSEA